MYLVLLVTHLGNLQRVLEEKSVWMERTGVKYIILYGDPDIEDDYYYDAKKCTLAVKTPDSYE
ncbi:hypothetical protein EB118_20730, partial [bacterium]|nr:hypothetical protein [bacterium]NDG32485.1 hypothetical protein [bacterium]